MQYGKESWGTLCNKTPSLIPDSLNVEIRSKNMRSQILKLTKRHSTKAERRFMEILKDLHIPFKSKVMIDGMEADFLIGNDVFEIDGHIQKPERNIRFINKGYLPFHLGNKDVTSPLIRKWLKEKYVNSNIRSKSIG